MTSKSCLPGVRGWYWCCVDAGTGAGCLPVDAPADATSTTDRSAATGLGRLAVAAWRSMSGYSRDRFPHWTSQARGCDTRAVVLQRDGSGVTVGERFEIAAGW